MSDLYDSANSPLDCYASSPFFGMSSRISFPQGERYSLNLPHQTSPSRVNRRENHLSVCNIFGGLGKFRIMASHNAPLHRKSLSAFTLTLNLPVGFAPSEPPARSLRPLHSEPDSPTPNCDNHPPDDRLHPPSVRLRVLPLHPAKGIASPWIPALFNTLCIITYIVC